MMNGYLEIDMKEAAIILGGKRNAETAQLVEMVATAAGMIAKAFYNAVRKSVYVMTWLNMTREFGAYRR